MLLSSVLLISKHWRINKEANSSTLSYIQEQNTDECSCTLKRVSNMRALITALYSNYLLLLINICNPNAVQAASCYWDSDCWGVEVSRWGPGRWAVSSRDCLGQQSRMGRQVWMRESRGGGESLPSTWPSSLSRRDHRERRREWELLRRRTRRAQSPATGARRAPRSCTAGILDGLWSPRLLLAQPLLPISDPSRGVRGHGRRRGKPRADAPQGCSNTSWMIEKENDCIYIMDSKPTRLRVNSYLKVTLCILLL